MALIGGTFGDGAATGTTESSIATILGSTREEYRQLDVRADRNNVGDIYIGATGVGVAAAWVQLGPGESWGLNPASYTAPAGGDFKFAPSSIYLVGTLVADQAFLSALQ